MIAGIQERDPLDAGSTQSASASSSGATSSSAASTSASASSSSSSSGDAGPSNCAEVYVSSAGDDSEDGCDPKKPKKTIQAALAAAQASGKVMSINVCKGTYTEGTFNLGFAVSLLGGFDCSSWKPKPNAETILEAKVGLHTVDVSSASVTNAQKLSGFTIRGPAGDLGGTGVALWVGLNAAPEIFGNKIEGGSTLNKSGVGSIGMMIDSGSLPNVHDNDIDGGSGTSLGSHGSIGLYITNVGGSAFVHDNTIAGGAGKEMVKGGASGSIGMLVSGNAPFTVANGNPIQGNFIKGGTGTCDTDGTPSTGIRVVGNQDLDLVSNVVDAGSGTQGNNGPIGAILTGSGKVQVLKNRVNGGIANALMIQTYGSRGVVVQGAGSLLVENNEILGGDSTMAGGQAIGLQVTSVTSPQVVANTIVGGVTKSLRSPAMLLATNVVTAVIQDNVLASVDDVYGASLEVGSCLSVQKFEGNALFNAPMGLLYSDSKKGACNMGAYSTIDAVQMQLTGSGAQAAGNRTIAASCGADAGCVVVAGCNGAQACLDTTFAAFDALTHGAATLTGAGWKLSLTTPCAIAKGPLDLTGVVTDDLYGNARAKPFSIGAHQQNTSCL